MTNSPTPHLPPGSVPADTQRVKESPGRAGALGSIEELLGRPDSIPKRETRYHPKALRVHRAVPSNQIR
jgi:hypothetical protein